MCASEIERGADRIALPVNLRDELLHSLVTLGSPYESIDDLLVSVYAIFAKLPKDMLRKIFRFRADPNASGSLLLEGFPIDEDLPPTPTDGRRSLEKKTFISEASLLGVAQLLGQPFGYLAENDGEIIHNLCPVQSEMSATSSESSEISLGFHTDFNFDKDNPEHPFNVTNPDYIVLICLRADRHGQARTSYAAAQDICKHLTANEVGVLRKPAFQFAASYSFTGTCGADRLWSVPSAVLTGPDMYPEVSFDLLCGVRGLTKEATAILEKLRHICLLSDVSSGVLLKPGDVLLMDNRKGAHARSSFKAYFDGRDRWVQRVYVRRSLWELRKGANQPLRVF